MRGTRAGQLLVSSLVFNITGGEIIIILLLALIVLGPDKLPEFVRWAGRAYGEIKKLTGSFGSEFRDAIESPMREMQETANIARSWFEEGRSEADKEATPPEGIPAVDPIEAAEPADESSDEPVLESSDEPVLADLESVDDEEFDDADDDPNFYDDDGQLLDSDAVARMIAEAEGVDIPATEDPAEPSGPPA